MTLAALELPTHTLKVGNTDLTVRGLAFGDVALLIQNNRDELDRLIGMFTSEEKLDADAGDMVFQFVSQMPALAAKVIAYAADEPGLAGKAARLPLPTQLDAVMAIGRLTFEESGGVKKFAEQVVQLLGAMTEATSLLGSPSLHSGAKPQ